ncbi:MAG TPA: STAS domain-containing protein [Solirubrobacteraceae bacterium]|jgi:anti-anti-sigma factor|nr:STAS domain-containing protein [Solirubrobacteraceae bacterium]
MSTGPAHETSPGQLTPFSVDCSRTDGGPVIAAIAGDVDIANAESLVDAVLTRAQTDPKPGVVLDFTAVDFMDSTGIRAILEIAQHLDDDDAAGLVLMNPASSVAKLLSLAGLDDRIPVATSLEQALAVLAASADQT